MPITKVSKTNSSCHLLFANLFITLNLILDLWHRHYTDLTVWQSGYIKILKNTSVQLAFSETVLSKELEKNNKIFIYLKQAYTSQGHYAVSAVQLENNNTGLNQN